MISQKNQRMITALGRIRPRKPRSEQSIELQVAIDVAINLLRLDIDQERITEYKKGYKDGQQDAFLAQQNLKVRTHPECIS